VVIDIHHGRLGQFGEQARYARTLLARARPRSLGHTYCVAASAEDHFLLVATQQAYAKPALRIADVYGAIGALRRPTELNWDYVFATALSMGMLANVSSYLQYLDRLHRRLLHQPLVGRDLLVRFATATERPPADAERTDVRFPPVGTSGRLYLNNVHAAIEAGRWHSMARLLLLPVVAALAATPRRSS
jgi:hypothetical protein